MAPSPITAINEVPNHFTIGQTLVRATVYPAEAWLSVWAIGGWHELIRIPRGWSNETKEYETVASVTDRLLIAARALLDARRP